MVGYYIYLQRDENLPGKPRARNRPGAKIMADDYRYKGLDIEYIDTHTKQVRKVSSLDVHSIERGNWSPINLLTDLTEVKFRKK